MTDKWSTARTNATGDLPDAEFIEACRYCVVVFVDQTCNQFCLYMNEPSQSDLDSLREELATDPALGLTEVASDRITFRVISK